jgi:hypothetical protein
MIAAHRGMPGRRRVSALCGISGLFEKRWQNIRDRSGGSRHDCGTSRHTTKRPVTGLVPKGRIFLEKAAEYSKLFRHGSGTFRHE